LLRHGFLKVKVHTSFIHYLDNTCMESFFSHFKAECFYRYQFESSNEVKEAVRNYIKFYNNKRFQKNK
jgi:putative transposase